MLSATERIRLEGPASTAWRTIAPVLTRHVGTPTDDHCPWLLSGGTLLAARWAWHRDSNDIGVVAASDSALSLWPMADTAGRLQHLDAEFRRSGWILDPTRTTAWQRGYDHPETNQALDLFAGDPRPSMEPVKTLVDAARAYTATTTQVLYGKLQGRGHRAPVRDLYDIAVAGRTDPHALRRALRHIHATTLMRNLALQLQRTDQYRREAESHLVNPTDVQAAADPAPAAVHGMIASFPAIWRVTRSDTRWRIETFNVHERRLEGIEGSDSAAGEPVAPADEQLGAPANELLRRTPKDNRPIYRDPTVDAQLLALEREADKRATTPSRFEDTRLRDGPGLS